MYFDFEDYRPDISPVGRDISWREGVLLSIIVHLVGTIVVLVAPRFLPFDADAARARQLAVERQEQEKKDAPRFVFVQPRVDRPAPKPPERGEASDKNRQAQTVQRAKEPANPLPFSRGNTPERVEQMDQQTARGQGPQPDPAAGQQARVEPQAQPAPPDNARVPESQSALQLPSNRQPQAGLGGRSPLSGGSLGDALRNLQRYVQ